MRAKLICGTMLATALVTLFACGGKYGDAEKVYTEFADAIEAYIQALERSNDADAVAKAINVFADDLNELTPRMKEIISKYPELKEPKNLPEKLRHAKERSDQAAQRMGGTFMKATAYMGDDKVKAAFERLGQAMTLMGN